MRQARTRIINCFIENDKVQKGSSPLEDFIVISLRCDREGGELSGHILEGSLHSFDRLGVFLQVQICARDH